MQLPTPPTDNLYKFIAVFGLIIAVFSSFQMINQVNYLLKKEDAIKLEEELLKLKTFRDSTIETRISPDKNIRYKEDSIRAEFEKVAFSKELKIKAKWFMPILGLSTTVGISAMIFGFILWYRKTQRYQDKILINDAERSLIEKKQFKDKIQFEQEIVFYKKLWKDLTNIKHNLFYIINTQEKYENEDNPEKKKIYYNKVREKIKESIIPMNDLLYFIGENELFYPLIFKKKFKEIRKIFSDTIKDVELISRLSKDYILDDEFADLKGNLEKIEKSMNELLIDIKSNINEYGSIDINEIFSNKIDLNNKVRQ
ncbi:MAG: hypothetical protein A2W99_05340 [Bacteroidetes bacterium GWF2_33_16]|nr:MAG: hypothetical protein A2X00_17860 [Bacteroidetes bacterium GWE2_32_14]OFY06086.1 MAG: hypothetical protein A2W99_05340 [Bacteroidetes bacterium GWF2_33_16]